MFQTFISRHNSNFFSDKLVLTSVTPASSAPVLQTPKATSSTLYFDSLTVNAGNGGFLHCIQMDTSVNAANQVVSVGADIAFDADPKFFACLVRFESSSVPTTLPTAYDVYPLDGRHDGGYYTVKDCVTIDVLPRTPGNNVYVGFIDRKSGSAGMPRPISYAVFCLKKKTKNSSVLLNLGYNYMATRNFEAADKIFDRGLEAAPESFGSRALKSELAIRWKGDLSVAEKELASVPPGIDPQGLVTLGRAGVLTLQRKFKEALRVIQQFRGETLLVSASTTCPKASLEGTLYSYLDDKA